MVGGRGRQCVDNRKAVPLNDRVAQKDTVMFLEIGCTLLKLLCLKLLAGASHLEKFGERGENHQVKWGKWEPPAQASLQPQWGTCPGTPGPRQLGIACAKSSAISSTTPD